MIVGLIIGILAAILFCAISFGVASDNCWDFIDYHEDVYLDNGKRIEGKKYVTPFGIFVITLFIFTICLSMFIGARVHARTFELDIAKFEMAKETYSGAIKNKDISGLERIEIVNKIVEENKKLARLKHDASKWYYFYLPDDLVENLELIKLG